MSVKLSLTGIKEIDAVLKGLPLQLQDRVLKTAHADAAKPLVDTAKSIVPVGKTGNLKDSIGVERISLKRTNEVGLVAVGPRRKGGKKGFHGHLIEFGHNVVKGGSLPGRRSKTGRAGMGVIVSKVQPNPFMEPAFNMTKSLIESRIAESLGKKLAQFVDRTVKKK